MNYKIWYENILLNKNVVYESNVIPFHFLFQVFVGGAADGVLYPGDKVASINHQDTSRMTHHDAQNLLRKAGTSAQLNIVRPGVVDSQQGMKLNRSSSLGSSNSGKSQKFIFIDFSHFKDLLRNQSENQCHMLFDQ